jgi:hypothetical protein
MVISANFQQVVQVQELAVFYRLIYPQIMCKLSANLRKNGASFASFCVCDWSKRKNAEVDFTFGGGNSYGSEETGYGRGLQQGTGWRNGGELGTEFNLEFVIAGRKIVKAETSVGRTEGPVVAAGTGGFKAFGRTPEGAVGVSIFIACSDESFSVGIGIWAREVAD